MDIRPDPQAPEARFQDPRTLSVPPVSLRTERLVLRPFRADDLAPFAALNADPEVMRHFPETLSRAASDALVDRIMAHYDRHGFTFWAVEAPGTAPFVGMVGLLVTAFEAHFTPCVEVGWRLARPWWGRGYATEAARTCLSFGFGTLGLAEIVALTRPDNRASRAVMERLGMGRDPADDFDHPRLGPDHPMRRHVLYRLRAGDHHAGDHRAAGSAAGG